jgi:hypothetical protein
MTKTRSIIGGVLVAAALVLSACSGSKEDGDKETTTPTEQTTEETTPEVVIDQEIKDKLNVEPGSAIIPGSIESVEQDLGEECTAHVSQIRDLMKKYPSLRQVPPGGADAAIEEARKCEAVNAQEWADFYTKELAGWIYAKTEG